MFLGMITNGGLILFSKEFEINSFLSYKLIAFIIFENMTLLLILVINYDLLPYWFSHNETAIKELYEKNFVRRRGGNLPHLRLINKQKELEKKLGKNLESFYHKIDYSKGNIENLNDSKEKIINDKDKNELNTRAIEMQLL